MLLSATSYITGRDIMLANSNRLKGDSFKNREKVTHVGQWISIKTRNRNRLIHSQTMIRFCCHETRNLDFGPFIDHLNRSIRELGRFYYRIDDFDWSFHFLSSTKPFKDVLLHDHPNQTHLINRRDLLETVKEIFNAYSKNKNIYNDGEESESLLQHAKRSMMKLLIDTRENEKKKSKDSLSHSSTCS